MIRFNSGTEDEGFIEGNAPRNIIATGKAMEAAIDQAIDEWVRRFPHEAALFPSEMRVRRSGDPSKKYVTKSRTFHEYAHIPRYVYVRIGQLLGGVDWMLDEDCRVAFFKRFSECLMRPREAPGKDGSIT